MSGFQGTGGNLFGYLSQTYGAEGQKQKTGEQAQPINSLYEDQESMSQLQDLDSNLKLLFKKIQKKDVATKTKGLAELKILFEKQDKDELAKITGYYIYVFNRIMATEYDRKVRELANDLLGIIINKAKTSLGTYVTKVVPYWYLAQCDSSAEVAAVAKANYDICFPKDKQTKVFGMCMEAFLNLAHEYLKSPKESLLEDLGTISDADKEDIYERVMSSVLRAICHLFTMASAEEELKAKYVAGVIKVLNLEETESPLSRLLSGKFKSGIRAAALELIVCLLENVKDSVIKTHEAKLSEFVLYSISENNIRIQNVLWGQALVKFSKTCQNCWDYLNVKKAFLNKLYQCLRKAAFGASPPLYQNFVVFLSLLPFIKLDPSAIKPELVHKDSEEAKPESEPQAPAAKEEVEKEEKKGGKGEKDKKKKLKAARREGAVGEQLTLEEQLGTIKDIMSNLFSAIYSDEAIIYHDKLVTSYFDCCLLIIWKRILPFLNTSPEPKLATLAMDTAYALIVQPLEIFYQSKVGAPGLAQKSYELVGNSFGVLFNNLRERKLPNEFLDKLEIFTVTKLNELFISPHNIISELHLNLLHSLCVTIPASASKEGFMFRSELIKVVHNFHDLQRKKIAEEISIAKVGSKESLVDKLHLYCIVTYKFLCVTDTPLLLSAYSDVKDSLIECEWLYKGLNNPIIEKEIIQFFMLSVSAIFNAMGSKYQELFDRLLETADGTTSNPDSPVKNVEGRKLLTKYSINALAVTLDLEKKLLHKQGKVERAPPRQEKNDLVGLSSLINNSKIWPKIVQTQTRILLDPKTSPESIEGHKQIFVNLVEHYIEKGKGNAELPAFASISLLVDIISEELAACKSIDKYKLIEDILIAIMGPIIGSPIMSIEGKLKTSCEKLCLASMSLIYNLIPYFPGPIQQSKMWELAKKALNSQYLPAEKIYKTYVEQLREITQKFLLNDGKTAPSEDSITKYIQYIQTFVGIARSKEHSEITILKDVIFPNLLIANANAECLFADMSRLRVFGELFLKGGVGAAIPAMVISKLENGQYPFIGLCSEMLKSLYLPCTGTNINIRNQITLYTDIELIPSFVSPFTPGSSKEDKQAFMKFLLKNLEEKSAAKGSLYPYALEHLLNQLMLAQAEERSVLDKKTFEALFEEDILPQLKSIYDPAAEVKKNFYNLILHMLLCIEKELRTAKSEKYLSFIQRNKDYILKFIKDNDDHSLGSFANIIGLYSSSVGAEEGKDMDFHSKVFSYIVSKLPSFNTEQKGCIFSYFAKLFVACADSAELLMKKLGLEVKDTFAIIVQGIQSCEKEHEAVPQLVLHICEVITILVDKVPESVQNSNMEVLLNRVIELAYIKCQEYKIRIETPAGRVHEFEYEMFQRLGLLLEKCAKYVSYKVSEELLFSLIASNIESLQKAGYSILKYIYINSLPTLQYPAQEKWEVSSVLEEGKEEYKGKLEQSKYEDLNKNIPMALIEMIEKVPRISDIFHDPLKESKRTVTSVESLIMSAETQEEEKEEDQYALIPEMYGYVLCWNCLLHKVYYGWLHSRKAKNDDYLAVLNSISVFLSSNKTLYEMLLIYLTAFLPTSPKFMSKIKEEDVIGFDPTTLSLHSGHDIGKLALYSIFNFMKNYPSLARNFYSQCDPVIAKLIANVVTKVISPTIWFAEATNLHNCQEILKENKLEVTMMNTTREILAAISKDDVEFSISLKFPPNYPLKSIEVVHLKGGVFTEFEIKKWGISMGKLISSQNCDILGALMLWKANYDMKFEGVEACPICYSIVHEDTYSIPTLQCKTCKNKFHAACLKKWFRTSHKNKCPFCQNYFF